MGEYLNNAVFVNWFEHGRLCWLRDRSMTYTSIPETHGVRIVVVQQDVSYKAEVKLGDVLELTTRIAKLGNSSFTFEHTLAFAGVGVGIAVQDRGKRFWGCRHGRSNTRSSAAVSARKCNRVSSSIAAPSP